MEAGTITKWLKSPGDTVEKGEPLFEIDTDKVTQEVESDYAGVLLRSRSNPAGAGRPNDRLHRPAGEEVAEAAAPEAPPAKVSDTGAPRETPAAPEAPAAKVSDTGAPRETPAETKGVRHQW